jgi:hypothetical protein
MSRFLLLVLFHVIKIKYIRKPFLKKSNRTLIFFFFALYCDLIPPSLFDRYVFPSYDDKAPLLKCLFYVSSFIMIPYKTVSQSRLIDGLSCYVNLFSNGFNLFSAFPGSLVRFPSITDYFFSTSVYLFFSFLNEILHFHLKEACTQNFMPSNAVEVVEFCVQRFRVFVHKH